MVFCINKSTFFVVFVHKVILRWCIILKKGDNGQRADYYHWDRQMKSWMMMALWSGYSTPLQVSWHSSTKITYACRIPNNTFYKYFSQWRLWYNPRVEIIAMKHIVLEFCTHEKKKNRSLRLFIASEGCDHHGSPNHEESLNRAQSSSHSDLHHCCSYLNRLEG